MNRTKMSIGRERGKKWNLGLSERRKKEKAWYGKLLLSVYVGNFGGKRTKNGKTAKKERNR